MTKFLSSRMSIVNNLLLPFFLIGVYWLYTFLYNTNFQCIKDCNCLKFLLEHFPETLNLEAKIKLVSLLFLLCADILIFCIFYVIIVRIVKADTGFTDKTNLLIAGLNRAIKLTIEQSFIFGGFFIFWLFYSAKASDGKEAMYFVLIYIVARIISLLGFLLNHATKVFGLRTSGFALGVLINLSILRRVFSLSVPYLV